MLKGHTTNEKYEECLKKGFCKDHLKELEIKDEGEGYELQRKAMLYIRLQVCAPLLFNKPFSSEKMKTLFAKSKCFPDRNDKKRDFMEAITVLDSVVVYTLCHFSKVCCGGILYQSDKVKQVHDLDNQRIVELLNKKVLEESDISHFNPILKENFTDFEKNLIKISYVTALLYVRNVTMSMKLGEALNKLNTELNSVSREGEKWKIIGNDSYMAKRYEEAVNAFSSAIIYNPYSIPLLKNRAQTYLRLKQFNWAALDYYIILVLNPMSLKSYYKLSYSLLHHKFYYESYLVAEFALEKFKDRQQTIPKIYDSFEKMRDMSERWMERAFPIAIKMESERETFTSSEEEVDIPDLIEASDSESETQDIPDLMDASDSEESESEEAMNKVRHGEKKVEIPVASTQKPESCFRDEKEEKRENLSWSIKEASCILLDGCGLMAIPRYHEALNELKAHPEIYSYEECDILCIKYAYGCALCKSKEYDDLQKAISVFREITEEHKTFMFPAAHYGIGLAYFKLNLFNDALVHLKAVNDILQKEIPFKVCNWPELNTAIEETNPEHLKVIVDELIRECENPPPPDAVCRFDKCSLRASIYLTDPDFKGYYFIRCSEQCCLQYHPQCWKILRSLKQCTDKAFLEQKCFTPDCEGAISKIQSVCKEGNIEKTFSAETKKLAKQKRSKVGKKSELKEDKKRRRRDSTSKSESAEVPEEKSCSSLPEVETNGHSKESKSSTKLGVNENNEDDASSSMLSANAKPFIMFKKEKLVDEYASKASTKSKEHKKMKSNTIPIDEFLQHDQSDDYSRRLNAIREKNKSIIEGSWTNCNKSIYQAGNSCPTSLKVGHTNHIPFETRSSNALMPTPSIAPNYAEIISTENNTAAAPFYDPPIDISVIESVKKEVYSYLKNLLQKHGPLRVDDPILVDELKDFPPIANKVIADCDGVGGFLKSHLDFALVGETYVCVVSDVVAAYEKLSGIDKLKSLPSYNAYSVADDVERGEAFNKSDLNPTAEEYLPPSVENSALSDENINRNSPGLVSAISKLRQPLAVDVENVTEKIKKACGTSQYRESSEARNRSSFSSDVVPKSSSPLEKVTAMLEKFLDCVDIYYSEDMDQYRSYVDERMKPYCIVQLPKKSNVCIQTENSEVEKVSKGTMKTDEELEKVKEITCFLTNDKKELLQRIQVLEKERNAALSSVVKNQIESNTEFDNIKKELVDLKSVLDNQQSEFEKKKEMLEKENANLLEKLKMSEELNSNQKTALSEILSSNESMKTTIKNLQDFVGVMENEKKLTEKSVNLQNDKLRNNIKTLEAEKLQVLERAKYAEHLLLHLKKSDYLRRIDAKAAEAAMRMKQLQEGKSLMPGNMNPVLIKNLEMGIAQMKEYIIKLHDIRKNFMVLIDEQINQVNNGIPLNEIRPIDIADLPELPSWTNAALNAQPPSWTTQAQSVGSANNKPSLNTSAPSSTTNLAPANRQPDSLQRAVLPQKPVGNENSAVPATDNKLAPTVQSLFSALGSQPMLRPQIFNAKQAQQPQTEVKTKSDVSVSAAKEPLVPVAACSEAEISAKSVASSSLELDYNVKKNDIKKTVSAAVSQESLQHEPKNCYEKLLRKLHLRFPQYTQPQLMDFVKEFRDQRNGKLSGLTMDSIINRVSLLIESKKEKTPPSDEGTKSRPIPPVLVNKKLVSKETKAKKPPVEMDAQKKCPWGKGDGDSSKQWSGNNIDDGCTICFEDMSRNAFRVDCGHCFHYKCIKEWLSKKSDCPICRVHLLLPDDYPALK